MNNIQPIWLRYGILYGIISILLSLIFLYLIPSSIGYQSILMTFVMILIFVFAAKAQRNENDDILPYGEALKTTFLTGFSGSVISTLFTIILVTLIDPSIIEKLVDITLEMTESMYESLGMPEDKIAETIEKAEVQIGNSFSATGLLMGLVWSALINLIIAAIVSIFVKKEETYS